MIFDRTAFMQGAVPHVRVQGRTLCAEPLARPSPGHADWATYGSRRWRDLCSAFGEI
jgi:hypothetical protein